MEKPIIGLCFSGGGYRAATFDLGVLSYLNSVTLDEGGTLLDCVVAMSSVSGGTIPAMRYMLALTENQPVDEMVKELFGFLCENDLVSEALGRMNDEKANPNVSLIRIMADIYDEYLFRGQVLGAIMDGYAVPNNNIHVKDYTALATDFNTALPFRFRVAESIKSRGGHYKPDYVFGNDGHRIKLDDARWITMGEALACSSCFPSGFEPMMFPEDFKRLSEHKEIADNYKTEMVESKDGMKEWHGFGIMDGGVADNEGIESILLAEERMRSHSSMVDDSVEDIPAGSASAERNSADKAFDLVIISDVSSPDIKEGFVPHKQMLWKWLGNLTMDRLHNYGMVIGAVLLACLVLALFKGNSFWTVVTTALLAIVSCLVIGGSWLKNKAHSMIAETFIGDRARFIRNMKFAACESLLMNRAMSIVKMSSEVFLKRQRQMTYSRIHDDQGWTNRRISNLVYELCSGKRGTTKQHVDPDLKPQNKIQEVSALAAGMGTTLWFTDEDKRKGVPQALFAAGQYTICYNLLDYSEKIQQNPTNLTAAHATILALQPRLKEDWMKFQDNPIWMVP